MSSTDAEKEPRTFPVVNQDLLKVVWKPLLLEPVAGVGERISVGVVAVSSENRVIATRAFDRQRMTGLFGAKASHFAAVVDVAMESVRRHAETAGLEADWKAPFEGVELGPMKQSFLTSPGEFHQVVMLAAAGLAKPAEPVLETSAEASGNWDESVDRVLKRLRPGLSNSLNAQVRLGRWDSPVTFTFFGASFAADVVRLSPKRLKPTLDRARASLWNLSMLADAPSLLFRPESRSLIAGVDSDTETAEVNEAIEELAEEAKRREVEVFSVGSSEEAARAIALRAA